jgi:hypothetical protein
MPGATRGSARSTVSCEHPNRSMFCAEADCARSVPAARDFQYMMEVRRAGEGEVLMFDCALRATCTEGSSYFAPLDQSELEMW